MTAMRRVLVLAMLVLLASACGAPGRPAQPAWAPALPPARLVLSDATDEIQPWLGTLERAVDPTTLADVPGPEPIEFAACGSAPLPSPDGRLLAIAVGWRGPTPSGQPVACNSGADEMGLRLFDLERWAWRTPDLGVRASTLRPLAWSPDGQRLYAVSSSAERNRLGGLDHEDEVLRLWVVDPSGARPAVARALPFAFWGVHVAPDGSALYTLSYTLDPTERAWVAVDPTFLAVLDPATGAERTRVNLPGVKFAQREQLDQRGQAAYWSYDPGVVFAPDGSRAYIAHPDEPLLDVVDLRTTRLERTVRVDVPAGVLEHLLDLFARPAIAKGGPVAAALLAISPDRERLFTRLLGEEAGAGLLEVDARTWQVGRFDATATGVWPSTDGKWLFVTEQPFTDRTGAPPAARTTTGAQRWDGGRLRVLDAGSGREVAELLRDRLVQQLVMRGADRLYVVTPTAAYHGTQPYQAGQALMELIGYEVGTWRELARRAGGVDLRLTVPEVR